MSLKWSWEKSRHLVMVNAEGEVTRANVGPERLMRLLGFLAAAKRPMRLFKTIDRARRWIRSTPHGRRTGTGRRA